MSQSGSRSRSRSASGSASGSRSSSNSMKLPEQAPQPESGSPTDGPAAVPYPPAPANVPEVPSVFIGLGPAARQVTMDEVAAALKNKALNPENIREVRMRGRCAFADTTTIEEARHLIAELNNTILKDTIRLTVQMSRQTLEEAKERRRERHEARDDRREPGAASTNNGCQIFVHLGPRSDSVTNEEVRAKVEEVCPVVKMERRGQSIFVDVSSPEETQRVIAALNDSHIGDVRLHLRVAESRRKRDRVVAPRRRDERSPRRRESRRSRSREMDRRRSSRHHHHRSRRSYTPSSRSSSRSYSRGRRSYSSDSADSRGPRRGHRGGHRGGPRGGHRGGPRREDRREAPRDDRRRDAPRDAPREDRRDRRDRR